MSGELCVWLTGPLGVLAIACRLLVWLKTAEFAPVALPLKPLLWFCSMSSDTFAPRLAEFSFCVTDPGALAVEVSI